MARRETFPFLTSFFAFLAVYSLDAYGCDNGYYSVRMPNGGMMGHGGTTCQQCPRGFPNSDNGATKQEQCYKLVGGRGSQTRVYYGSIECGRGKYLPKNSSSCAVCLDGRACAGGWFQQNQNEDQGIIECTGGLVPDTGRSKCIDPEHSGQVSIHCPANYYLPASTINPAQCRSGCVCPGGDYYYSDREEQGINCSGSPRQCDAGKYYEEQNNRCENCPANFPSSDAGLVGREKCYGTYNNRKIYYKEIQCDPGKYLPAKSDQCETCLSGYACPGEKHFPDPSVAQGLVLCASGQVNSAKTECINQTSCNAGWYYDSTSANCAICPTGFTNSNTGSVGREKCYGTYNNRKIYYKEIQCDPGKYLPAKSDQCETCLAGYACRGTKQFPSPSIAQGLVLCASGQVNSAKTECLTSGTTHCDSGQYYVQNTCKDCPNGFSASDTDATKKEQCYTVVDGTKLYYKSIKCDPGTYLKKSSGSCSACADGYVCYGGTYWTSTTQDQGLKTCPSGKIPNANQTGCTDKENYGTVVNCEPGEYLPAGLGRCRKCSDNKKYCPGGQLTSSTTDQGLIDCPYGATANSGHTSCNFTLNQNRLKFGPKGKSTPFTNQCWTLINTYDYAKCVLKTTGLITGGGAIRDDKQQAEQVQNYAPDLK